MAVSPKNNEEPDDIWTVFVFFSEYTVSNRGRMLITDMQNSREVIVFYF